MVVTVRAAIESERYGRLVVFDAHHRCPAPKIGIEGLGSLQATLPKESAFFPKSHRWISPARILLLRILLAESTPATHSLNPAAKLLRGARSNGTEPGAATTIHKNITALNPGFRFIGDLYNDLSVAALDLRIER